MLKNMRARNKEKNMKITKRFFIVMLALAVLASSFALTAFAAEETSNGVNCDSLLAYFEEEIIFGYDFAEGELGYSDSLMLGRADSVTQSFVSDDSVVGGRYLELAIGNSGPKVKSAYFNWNSEQGVDEFYFDTVLSADKNGANGAKYVIVVNDKEFTSVGEGSTAGLSLVTLNFADGVVTYVSGMETDEDGKVTYLTGNAEYALTEGAWYAVSFDYDAQNGVKLVVTNVADAEDTVTVEDIYLPFETVKNIRFGVHKEQSEGVVLKLASVCAATGSARFNVSNHQKGVENEILKIYESYTSPDISIDDKLGVCDVINAVLGHGFTTTNAAVNAAIKDIKLGSINLYANALADSLAVFNAPGTYYAKREAIDAGLEYASVLEKTDLSPASAAELAVILSNISAVRSADVTLTNVETNSLSYIALLSELGDGLNSGDYQLLLSYYDAATALNPDLTYEGVADVNAIYLAIADKMEEIELEAEAFIADLDHLGNTERDFMDRYYHYLQFKDNVYENETYPGITEALNKYNNVVLPEILENIGYAENFILYVEKADFSTYISAKEENIRIADGYEKLCHPDFPGVAEAKALRVEVLAFIQLQKENANKYIEAVKALSTLTGNDLLAGIENAKELQKTGNVLGVDGVTDANMKLEQISSSKEIKESYSKYFITLVQSLESLETAEEIYSVLAEAKRAEGKADQTFPGVSEASVDLDTYITGYNDSVYFTNIEFVYATNVAANTAGIGTISNSVADYVIGLIPRLSEDEED